jgi:hypothetical protein
VAAEVGSTSCWLAFQAIVSVAPAAVQGVQSDLVAFNPTPGFGSHGTAFDRHAKQRVTLNVVCSFNM